MFAGSGWSERGLVLSADSDHVWHLLVFGEAPGDCVDNGGNSKPELNLSVTYLRLLLEDDLFSRQPILDWVRAPKPLLSGRLQQSRCVEARRVKAVSH